jgi:Leucine rich repeat/Leucine Rich repeat
MSSITQKLTTTSLFTTKLSHPLTSTICSFISYHDLTHNIHPVCKQWQHILPDDGTLHLENSPITDQELIKLIDKHRKPITSIKLYNCQNITDKGLKYISKLTKLTELDLTMCKRATDKGIKHLSKLPRLTTLNLILCNVTDASLKSLAKSQNLQSLNLRGCHITDQGIKDLIPLKGLQSLNLRGSSITDSGVKALIALKHLKKLDLSTCNAVTDIGGNCIAKLKNLADLDLRGCDKITGRSLEHLVQLPHLKKLNQKDIEQFDPIKRISTEKAAFKKFIKEKSKKFGIKCEHRFQANLYGMSIQTKDKGFLILIDSLYLLVEKDIDVFLGQFPVYREAIRKFLDQKDPHLLDKAAIDLIKWFNDNKAYPQKITATLSNKIEAKECLIMHALGNLSSRKRLGLTHEMGHGHDWYGAHSLGSFNPKVFNFIEPHQFSEVTADLTAAREENAHQTAITFFKWHSHIANQPSATDVHPSDLKRAKAIQMDYDNIQKALKRKK